MPEVEVAPVLRHDLGETDRGAGHVLAAARVFIDRALGKALALAGVENAVVRFDLVTGKTLGDDHCRLYLLRLTGDHHFGVHALGAHNFGAVVGLHFVHGNILLKIIIRTDSHC